MKKIIRNVARCKKCGDVIESTYRNEFVSCTCGDIYVDGGLDYIRRGGIMKNIEEFSVFDEMERIKNLLEKNSYQLDNFTYGERVEFNFNNSESWMDGTIEIIDRDGGGLYWTVCPSFDILSDREILYKHIPIVNVRKKCDVEEEVEKFDPRKVKKFTQEEIIRKMKEEEQEQLENRPSGVFIDFSEIKRKNRVDMTIEEQSFLNTASKGEEQKEREEILHNLKLIFENLNNALKEDIQVLIKRIQTMSDSEYETIVEEIPFETGLQDDMIQEEIPNYGDEE